MDVLATGYPSMDFIIRVTHSPGVGETALIQSAPERFNFGGCGANVAVALAELGFTTGVAMIVGRDRHGDDYTQYLMQRGINIANLIRLPDAQTSLSYLFLNADHQHQNFFLPGAADAWRGELQLSHLDSCRYALVTVGPLHYNTQFVKLTREAGVSLIWELKPDIFAYPPDVLHTFHEASAHILMNHIEAKYVLDSLQLRSAEELLNETTQTVVVTNGAEGATVYSSSGATSVPVVPPTTVVDPTGAGDGFTTGYIAGLLRDETPKTSAQIGAAMASFVIESMGCQTNLPTWQMLKARYEEHFGAL